MYLSVCSKYSQLKGCLISQRTVFSRIAFLLAIFFPLSGICDEDYDRCVSSFGSDGILLIDVIESLADNGNIDAEYCMAVAYHEGKSVLRDQTEAVKWYLRAGQRGHLEAQYWLCIIYLEGIGVEGNALESLYWCRRAAKKKHPKALYALGQLYYGGYDRNMNTNYLNAYVWFSRAVVAGEDSAQDMIRLLEEQMTDLQVLEAKKMLERNSR